jgi:MYXO-CTERM domain-containing protein
MGPNRALASACALCALLWPATAWSVYQCGDQKDDCQCGANNPYPCCDNGGNCTWWAWEAACCNWAVGLPGWGNANQWAGNAKAHADYDVVSSPVVGSIACRVSGTYGHVAWVTAVNGSSITVTEENCCSGCNYGLRTWNYQASWFDGGFIVRKAACACSAGQNQSEGCGNCGTRTRSCGGCSWNAWSGCSGEGPCAKGQTDQQDCGDCGTHARTCSESCQWGDFTACTGPDPNGGEDPCDTGLQGVCADGRKRCVEGNLQCAQVNEPSAELCDDRDNDCDGEVDNGVCGTLGPPPAAKDAGPAAHDGSTDGAGGSAVGDGGELYGHGAEQDAGCGCRTVGRSGAGGGLWLLWAGAAIAWMRRRRQA